MANLLIESCGDHYSSQAMARDKLRSSELPVSAGTIGAARTGNGFIGGSLGVTTLTFPAASEFYLGAAVYFSSQLTALSYYGLNSNQCFLWALDDLNASSYQVCLGITQAGQLFVWRGDNTFLGTSAPNVIRSLTWHYLEFGCKIASDTTGWVKVRVDGVEVLSLTGIVTRYSNGAVITRVLLGNGAYVQFDDIYVNDATGDTNNTFMGDIRVDSLLPTGAGSTSDWAASAGDDYQCVDENPPTEDTDYIESSTPGQRTTVAMADLPAGVQTVKAVQATIRARRPAGSARTVAVCLRDSGGDHDGTTRYPGAGYQFWRQTYDKQPDGSAWSPAAVNALEAGVVLVG